MIVACGSPGGDAIGDASGDGITGKQDGGNTGGPIVDGPPGSRVPGFDPSAPDPLIVLAHRVTPDAWVIALVDIAADGTTSGIVNYDRIRAFRPTSASLLADGAYPGAKLSSWNPSAPVPLVMLARRAGQATWVTGIAEILDDGTLSGITNVDRVRVWRLDGVPAPFHDGPVASAIVPGWNPAAPGPLVLGASRAQMPGWPIAIASISADGHLGELFADRAVGWLP